MKNRLRDARSPYLLQHADNPVDWFQWDDEALRLAKQKNMPILLSIGYAACHWCHVMAHESFEDPETAAVMNEHFVCIKVDREERPDLDQIYMTFVQMTTGSGGWPLNVFLTPELEPFYGGTYFPPEDRYGRPSWKKLLLSVSRFYHNDKASLGSNLQKIRQAYEMSLEEGSGDNLPTVADLNAAAAKLKGYYDPRNGGLGGAPKFPAVQPLTYFLHQYHRTGEAPFLEMVTKSLTKMAKGGIYDQIGGGFARYAVDERWLVPHFEKMLYDNAQLAELYLDAFQISHDPFFEKTARGILEFVSTELRDGKGGFYSSLDADSEGVEGKFYIWDKSELDAALGAHGQIFCDYFGVTTEGNFEGKNILHIPGSAEATARKFDTTPTAVKDVIHKGIRILKDIRARRVRPSLDDKILTSWNALMLSAFARAFQVLREAKFADIMKDNIGFIREELLEANRLYRSYHRGKSGIDGYLDDYAYLIKALIDAYEALFEDDLLILAYDLTKETNRQFLDHRNAGYFYTAGDQKQLLYRMKDLHDQSIPSANGIMLQNLLRLHSVTGEREFMTIAEKMMKRYLTDVQTNPYAFSSYLLALDYHVSRPYEIVVAAGPDQSYEHLLAPVFGRFLPNRTVILIREGHIPELISEDIAAGKHHSNKTATAYVCRNFACSQPVTDPEKLAKLLQEYQFDRKTALKST